MDNSVIRRRKQTQAAVFARWEANGRKCEGCKQVVQYVQCAHLFGKGTSAKIREEYASSPDLCAALCSSLSHTDGKLGCHEMIDQYRDPLLRDILRWVGVWRFANTHGIPAHILEEDELCLRPVGAIRACDRYLKETSNGLRY